jgi:hypothetical protein
MKLPNPVVAVSLAVLGLAISPLHAATRPSKISAFGGPCPGGVTASASGTVVSGTTQGSFSTSKVREVGTLSLTSSVNSGGTTVGLAEKYQFNKHSFSYTLFIGGGSVFGTGTANISTHVIKFSAVINASGSTFSIQGTIRQTKHRLFVDEILSGSGSSTSFDYVLRRPGKH